MCTESGEGGWFSLTSKHGIYPNLNVPVKIKQLLIQVYVVVVVVVVVSSDVDECSSSVPVCDVTATCENTIGSYSCTCPQAGFKSDGRGCIGKCDDVSSSVQTITTNILPISFQEPAFLFTSSRETPRLLTIQKPNQEFLIPV